jgi:DnaK suppressor protein
MTETRIEELRQVLGARRRRLQHDLVTKLRDAREDASGEGESRGLDTAETSDAHLQHDVSLALIEMRAEALRRIDDAVVRLASGAYGYCAECGDEISQKRLEALPFAERCRECEEAYEISARRSRQLAQRRTGPFGWIDATSRE